MRLWVEIHLLGNRCGGCCRQPPCEAVSWNYAVPVICCCCSSQPPCEAVSWNNIQLKYIDMSFVSLLVRLWVEMLTGKWPPVWRTSQPPCEAVSWNPLKPRAIRISCSQPPCEAVSWNTIIALKRLKAQNVSLLVRLWVEMCFTASVIRSASSASLWGCELKSSEFCTFSVSSSSASLWGCELKYQHCFPRKRGVRSASLWGCELKYDDNSPTVLPDYVSLLVRLWVEMDSTHEYLSG